mmetsp:Transcript_28342/g.32444  ORF Transcript_28342/g.32444 Transcript_28342/m.32444 type:complete len:167 (+) Transcript_28342:416-916(+)
MTAGVLIFPIIFDHKLNVGMFVIYFYCYCFMCLYQYLNSCKKSKWMIMINVATPFIAILVLPFVICYPLFDKVRFKRVHLQRNVDELESLGELKDVVMEIISYENKEQDPNELIIEPYNNLIQANERPDRGPKNVQGEDVCSVCTSSLLQGDVLVKTKCNHLYHFH